MKAHVRPPEEQAERDAFWIGAFAVLLLGAAAFGDVGYGDAGELGTAAVLLGVAHPTGFAVDLLWMKAASLLPLGDLAARLNAATALSGGVAIGLVAAIAGVLAVRVGVRDPVARRLGALASATALGGFSAFLWATRAVEVYALGLSAVLFGLYAVVRGRRSEPIAGVLVLLLGFAPGMHVTAGLYVLVMLIAYAFSRAYPVRWLLARLPLLLAGALVIAYLPLASLRNPALDWGDPESLGAILKHLTADRIRSAYRDDMFGGDVRAPLELFEQLAVFAGLVGAMVLACLLGLTTRKTAAHRAEALEAKAPVSQPPVSSRTRVLMLGIVLIGLLDLTYAIFVNPMGVRDFQVGHVAGACLSIVGGVSIAWLLMRLDARLPLRRWARGAALVVSLSQFSIGFDSEIGDGYVLGELYGSGGLVPRLPPRSLFLCMSDDACAAGMFALHVERVRPDMDVAPAQHLWDPTVLRQIEAIDELAPKGFLGDQRAERARRYVKALLEGRPRRPIALETHEIATQVAARVQLVPFSTSAMFTPGTLGDALALQPSLRALDTAYRARFFGLLPKSLRDRVLWSRVYGEVGAVGLRTPAFRAALGSLSRAASLAPERAVAWTNLGVAFESVGALDEAVDATRQALQIDPDRPTAWVNLGRLQQRRGDLAAARKVVQAARRAGIEDARLTALEKELAQATGAAAPKPAAP